MNRTKEEKGKGQQASGRWGGRGNQVLGSSKLSDQTETWRQQGRRKSFKQKGSWGCMGDEQ
jgi:hypothetical protein